MTAVGRVKSVDLDLSMSGEDSEAAVRCVQPGPDPFRTFSSVGSGRPNRLKRPSRACSALSCAQRVLLSGRTTTPEFARGEVNNRTPRGFPTSQPPTPPGP